VTLRSEISVDPGGRVQPPGHGVCARVQSQARPTISRTGTSSIRRRSASIAHHAAAEIAPCAGPPVSTEETYGAGCRAYEAEQKSSAVNSGAVRPEHRGTVLEPVQSGQAGDGGTAPELFVTSLKPTTRYALVRGSPPPSCLIHGLLLSRVMESACTDGRGVPSVPDLVFFRNDRCNYATGYVTRRGSTVPACRSPSSDAKPFKLPHVGMTARPAYPPPDGYPQVRVQVVLGHGPEVYEAARRTCSPGACHGAVPLGARHRPRRDAPGVARNQANRPGFRPCPCKVVWTARSRPVPGFAYGNLPGHPDCGRRRRSFSEQRPERLRRLHRARPQAARRPWYAPRRRPPHPGPKSARRPTLRRRTAPPVPKGGRGLTGGPGTIASGQSA